MSELQEKVKKSIERLQAFCPPEGYYLAFSGGKDSVVCKALLDMSGCKYDATYRVTSVDPPELVRFIKEQHPDVKREVPRYSTEYKNKELAGKPITMWNLIPEHKYPPTRLVRYCCRHLKESGGDGRMTVTGVRWAESRIRSTNQGLVTVYANRSKSSAKNLLQSEEGFMKNKSGGVILVNDNTESRRLIEQCYKRAKTNLNPIIDWSDEEVWEFIKTERIPYCCLYDEGFERIGCIGCPMASKKREQQFQRYPSYKASYIRAFEKMIVNRLKHGKSSDWITGEDVFNWWMEYDVLPGQVTFDDLEEDDE